MKGEEKSIIVGILILSVVVAGCLAPSYSVYDSGKIRFEYPSKYNVTENKSDTGEDDTLFFAKTPEDQIDPTESIEVLAWHNTTLDKRLKDYDPNLVDVLAKGEMNGKPAALCLGIIDYTEYTGPSDLGPLANMVFVWYLNTQVGKDVYEIRYSLSTLDMDFPRRNITLDGEKIEVPENFAHIIETLKFH